MSRFAVASVPTVWIVSAATAFGPLPLEVAHRYAHGYAVVDVETSGLSAAHHRVLQVAGSLMRPDGALETTWSTLLNPGCDPGPVHIHGLTRDKLSGAPQFADVAPHLTTLLTGRVLVAHNARFDWDFLSNEAERARSPLPVKTRLCTIALSRRLDIPVAAMSLDVVSAYWGVARLAAHDAVDDTRVLVEVLRHSLVAAHRLDATLPLTPCLADPDRPSMPPSSPRTPCPWKHPGRWTPGSPLVQGMKVAFTGDTKRPREVLIREATGAGLDVMNNVSSRTNLLVRNPSADVTRKAEAARVHATPVVDEQAWANLLSQVRAGTPKATPARASSPSAPPLQSTSRKASGPLAKHRVVVLGGPHAAARSVREHIAELGGQVAVNLTASVTDVVMLDDATSDPRHGRVIAAGIPSLNPTTLQAEMTAPARTVLDAPVLAADNGPEPIVLPHGGVTDLPADLDGWSLSIAWPDRLNPVEIDVVAFVVDDDEQVRVDEDMCFYNQPSHPSGAVDLELGTVNEALAVVRPSALPPDQQRIVFAAALDAAVAFGDVGPVELALRTTTGSIIVRATLDAATTEHSLLLGTLYLRAGTWRFRAVGQGYDTGLLHLAVQHGVDIED